MQVVQNGHTAESIRCLRYSQILHREVERTVKGTDTSELTRARGKVSLEARIKLMVMLAC